MGTQVGLSGAPHGWTAWGGIWALYTLSAQGDVEGPSRVRPATRPSQVPLWDLVCLGFTGLEDGETFGLQEARGNTRISIQQPGLRGVHSGGSTVKTLHFHCRGWGFDSWLGNKDPTWCVARPLPPKSLNNPVCLHSLFLRSTWDPKWQRGFTHHKSAQWSMCLSPVIILPIWATWHPHPLFTFSRQFVLGKRAEWTVF